MSDGTTSITARHRVRPTLPGTFTTERLREIAALSLSERARREAQRHIETDRITRKTP